MPISQINSGFASLPALSPQSREARVRQPTPELSEQFAERESRSTALESNSVDFIQPTDEIERILAASNTAETILRPGDNFDGLPSSAREALQSYLTNQQAGLNALSNDGSELIVGVDTFV